MSTDFRLGVHKYSTVKLLGKGCSGVVHEVSRQDDTQRFALKTVCGECMEENVIRQAFREASIMKRISSLNESGHDFHIPWIVTLEDFWVDEDHSDLERSPGSSIRVNMVLELVTGPSLESYLERLSHPRMKKRRTGGFSKVRPGEELSDDDEQVLAVFPEQVYAWMSQMVLALSVLHKLGVIHRDIKPANLILSHDLREMKVADFSISRIIQPGDAPIETTAGTLNYSAPEVLNGNPYGESCDLWSLGCVLYEIMTLSKAFKLANTNKILSTIYRREIPTIPDDCEPGLVMLCNRLMNPDPSKRPTALSLCKHPRLKNYVINQLLRIQRRPGRTSVIDFLDLNTIVPPQDCVYQQSLSDINQEYPMVVIDEENPGENGPIEDQFDDDVGYEILVLVQGSWIVENSSRRIQVDVNGRVFTFSDGRAPCRISRARRLGCDGPVEWLLGKDVILVKSLSSFMSPQKLFFAKFQGVIPKRVSSLDEACFILSRDEPLSTVYFSAASTASS